MDRPARHAHFASYVAALGRGPGRGRSLTRDEARDAFSMVLEGEADPMQVGAFLMLLRYRGEDADEIAGLVEAARAVAALGRAGRAVGFPEVDLDWPSYGAGRTRDAPWFLLGALALADSGVRVLMHGSNDFSGGISVAQALTALGRPVQRETAQIAAALMLSGFAYWPAISMAPSLEHLLGLRRLFGLRSPVNTVARLLDPADAAASVDGVFHPPYIATHLAVAERLRRPALLVLKGGGGEAERAPAKEVVVHFHRRDQEAREIVLPSLCRAGSRATDADGLALMRSIWRGERCDEIPVWTIVGTIGMALLALRRHESVAQADRAAWAIWDARKRRQQAGTIQAPPA